MARRPLPIIQYWHEADPPQQILDLTQSFVSQNPNRPHRLFDAESADAFIAGRLGDQNATAFRACALPALQADYFRYCSLFELGGIWADAGLRCVADLSPLLTTSQGAELFQSFVSRDLLINGFMAFATSRHPFLAVTVEFVTELIDRRWEGKVNAVSGFAISVAYRLCEAGSFAAFLRSVDELSEDLSPLRLSQYARILCEVIDDEGRLAELGRGINVHAAEERRRWVGSPDEPLPHREDGRHWSDAGTAIYVEDDRLTSEGS